MDICRRNGNRHRRNKYFRINITMKIRKNDIILLCSVLLISAVVFTVCLFLSDSNTDVAVITVDGEEYARLPLNKDTQLVIETKYGTNTVVTENGQVYITDADCPDKTCVKTGCADKLKPIVCLPHRLTVSIEAKE